MLTGPVATAVTRPDRSTRAMAGSELAHLPVGPVMVPPPAVVNAAEKRSVSPTGMVAFAGVMITAETWREY
jgi:hypothetical protein